MHFRVNLKMKKPKLCCCFKWIVFIELNFIVAFLLIRKTLDDRFAGKMGGLGILRNGGNDFEMGEAGGRAVYRLCYKIKGSNEIDL